MLQIDPAIFTGFFGQDAVIDDGSLKGQAIRCIFDEPAQVVSQYDGSVEMTAPAITAATADLDPAPEHGQAVTVGGKDYIITGIEPDGSGMTRLTLRERFD